MATLQHTVTIWYGTQQICSTVGNVPLFVPRKGDFIMVNHGKDRLTVDAVEVTYTDHGIFIAIRTVNNLGYAP